MRKRNECAEIKPKKGREEMHRDKERHGEREAVRECVWLWDYSYRAPEELMRCIIRQI